MLFQVRWIVGSIIVLVGGLITAACGQAMDSNAVMSTGFTFAGLGAMGIFACCQQESRSMVIVIEKK